MVGWHRDDRYGDSLLLKNDGELAVENETGSTGLRERLAERHIDIAAVRRVEADAARRRVLAQTHGTLIPLRPDAFGLRVDTDAMDKSEAYGDEHVVAGSEEG